VSRQGSIFSTSAGPFQRRRRSRPRLHPFRLSPDPFVTDSTSAPGLAEASEHRKAFPLLALFVRKAPGAPPEVTINLMLERGVRAALEYAASGDVAKARAATNPDVAPHLKFVDMAGHAYAVVSAEPEAIDTEFACIVRPIMRATTRRRPAALPGVALRKPVAAWHRTEDRAAVARARCSAVALMPFWRVAAWGRVARLTPLRMPADCRRWRRTRPGRRRGGPAYHRPRLCRHGPSHSRRREENRRFSVRC